MSEQDPAQDAASDGSTQSGTPATADPRPRFRLGMVPGVNPDRWARVWKERIRDHVLELVPVAAADAVAALRSGDVAASLLRLPVDRDGIDAIAMYTEATVVVVAKDHLFTAADEITSADLADETLVVPDDDVLRWSDAPGERFAGAVATTSDAVDLVAAGHAVLVAPHSVARLHLRRGVTTRPVVDAPGSAVGLAWLTAAYDELTEELIGIVRGRTASSSRGRGTAEQSPTTSPRKPTTSSSGKGSARGGGASTPSGQGGGRPGAGGRRAPGPRTSGGRKPGSGKGRKR